MKKIVTFGELLISLGTTGQSRLVQAESFTVRYTGAEANAAVSLAQFGLLPFVVSKVPEHQIGQACVNALRRFGVNTDYVVRGGDRLGLLYLEQGASQRPTKVIYDRAGSSIATIEPGMIDWQAVFADADWFHWTGITPAISAGTAAVCLEGVRAAKELGLTISCDLNFRKNLWKWGKKAGEVMPALVELCDVAIANEEEAEKASVPRLVGAALENLRDAAAKRLEGQNGEAETRIVEILARAAQDIRSA
jgi:2-dehydro-3-deoxygluconokinase